MPTILLPITMTIAAACALLNLWLAFRVSRVRMARRISVGHGSDPVLEARMRAQANFIEYTPFFLILLGLIELAQGSATWLWSVAIAYVFGRVLHAFGMDRPAPNKLRMIGILVTFLGLLGLAAYALAIPYLAPVATAAPASVAR